MTGDAECQGASVPGCEGENTDRPSSSPTPSLPHTLTLPARGTLLAFDHGTVRIGLAVSDPDRILASPLETYTRRSELLDAAHYAKTATDHRAAALVVGLPLHANGDESDSSRAARAFGAWLAGVTGLPVVFWDERFTTSLAEDALLGAKLSHKKRRDRRDRVAAQMILQNYIDAGCPPEGTVVSPLDSLDIDDPERT